MGHLFSRAIKRFTQCGNSTRNQLPSGGAASNQQQASSGVNREQDPDRPTVQSIPVGQSIDSADYAAFKTTQSSFDDRNEDGQREIASAEKENEISSPKNEEDASDQNKPEVEEAVIKIQALVRGHLTRKALKDAQQQAAAVPPNALGQSQFDEESLRNPPNAVFSNAPPASSKPANNRVPPLASIAEDVESANPSRLAREKRKSLSPLKQSSSGSAGGEPAEAQSPTSPNNEANASIDIHCDTPASASIDIVDHTSKPMPPMAAVLHHRSARAPHETTASATVPQRAEQEQQVRPSALALASAFNSVEAREPHATNASSLPASPPHINLALTSNSHSIDSAEAAAIRIQSAFRGYHTRKHSPYRRRSPASGASPTARPAAQMNGNNSSNGQAPRRNTLRQQDATVFDDDDDDADEGVEGCERLASGGVEHQDEEITSGRLGNEQSSEENRQSRQRHRSDEAHIEDSARDAAGARNTIDESTFTDDQNTVKEVQSGEERQHTSRTEETTPSSTATNRPAVLTRDEPAEGQSQSNERKKLSVREEADAGRWSTSLDTDSSNLGAALSLNEDLPEETSQASQDFSGALPRLSNQRESIGAALETAAEDSQANGASVSRSSNEQQLDELERVTSQLEAALDEATDKETNCFGEQLTENPTDQLLEGATNLNELESDDIERRDPSGVVSERAKTPLASESDQQPALVASSSLDEEAAQAELQPRLDVVSPDEAIGSGGSSPALVASHDGNSTDEGGAGDSDQDQQEQQQDERGGPSKVDGHQQGNGGGGKSKKRNRNKRKGKK